MTTRDTPWADGTPCWIDLMTTDPESARQFYGELFGWKITVGGPETGGYGMAEIDGRSVCGIGAIEEGMDHRPVWTTYLASGDCEATADAVVRAGGNLVAPTMDVMEFGRMAVAQDPTGGVFGVWQAKQHIGVGLANEPSTLSWNELLTREYDAAKEFYTAVFSCTYTEIGDENFQYSTIEVEGSTVGGLGGMPAGVPEQVPAHWRVYFAVDDADAAVETVTRLGGSVLRPASDMAYGRWADVADPQGAAFSIIKPAMPA